MSTRDNESIEQMIQAKSKQKQRLERELARVSSTNGQPREGYVEEWIDYHKQLKEINKQIELLQEQSQDQATEEPGSGHSTMSTDILREIFDRVDKLTTNEEFARALDVLNDAKRRAKTSEKEQIAKKEAEVRRAQAKASDAFLEELRALEKQAAPNLTQAQDSVERLERVMGKDDKLSREWRGRLNEWKRASDLQKLLQEADELSKRKEYLRALETLELARGKATRAELPLVKEKEDEIRRAQKQAAEPILEELRAQDKEKFPNLTNVERLINDLTTILGEDDPNVRNWQNRSVIWRKNTDAREQVAEVTRQLGELWRSGLLVDATEAFRLAEQYKNEQPEVTAWNKLYEEADRQRKAAAEREQAWTTAMLEGKFQIVIDELETLRNRGVKQLPWFEIEHGQFVAYGTAPAQDAFNKVVGLATTFENGKAEEYYHLAQDELARAPRSSRKRIEDDALKFKYLDDHWRKTLQDFLKETVEPAVEARDKLNRALLEAPTHAKNPDPRKAWQETCELALQDPNAESIETAKKIARMRVRPTFNADLVRAEDFLRVGKYEEALSKAQTVRDLTQGDEPFAEINLRAAQLVERAITDKSLNQRVAAEIARIDLLVETNVEQAGQDLTVVKRELGKRFSEFPELGKLEGKIKFRTNVEQAAREYHARLRAIEDPTELEKLELLARQEAKRLGAELAMQHLLDQIKARRAFLLGRQSYKDHQYEEAQKQFAIVVQLKGNDAEMAQRRLDEAASAAAQQGKAEFDYQTALDRYRFGDIEDALTLIEPWREKPIPQQRQFDKTYQEWKAEYEAGLVRELRQMEKKSPLPVREIEERLDKLEANNPRVGQEWKTRLLPRVYRVRAESAAAIGKLSDKESEKGAQYWLDRALEWDPANQELQELRRKIHIRQVFDIATQLAQGKPADAQIELEKLLLAHPKNSDEPKIWLRLAQVEFKQGRAHYRTSLDHLKLAYDKVGTATADLASEIQAESQRVAQELEIAEKKELIELQLAEDKSAQDYLQARANCEQLRAKYRDRAQEIKIFYRQRVDDIAAKLNSQLKALSPDEWRHRWRLAIKILQLDPNHREALAVQTHVTDAAVRLHVDVETLKKVQATGPATDDKHNHVAAQDALTEQLRQVREKYALAEEVVNFLDGYAQITQRSDETQKNVYQDRLDLGKMQSELGFLYNQTGRVRDALLVGNLTQADQILGAIRMANYGEHRTVKTLETEREQKATKLQELDNAIENLKRAVNEEDFQGALQALANAQQLDTYNRLQALRVIDPFDRSELRPLSAPGIPGLDQVMRQKLEQWEKIESWLSAEQKFRLDRASAEATVKTLIGNGEFTRARELAIEVMRGNEQGLVPTLSMHWSLAKSETYLGTPPPEIAKPSSQKAWNALQANQQTHKEISHALDYWEANYNAIAIQKLERERDRLKESFAQEIRKMRSTRNSAERQRYQIEAERIHNEIEQKFPGYYAKDKAFYEY